MTVLSVLLLLNGHGFNDIGRLKTIAGKRDHKLAGDEHRRPRADVIDVAAPIHEERLP
jgi:hypothetical protein